MKSCIIFLILAVSLVGCATHPSIYYSSSAPNAPICEKKYHTGEDKVFKDCIRKQKETERAEAKRTSSPEYIKLQAKLEKEALAEQARIEKEERIEQARVEKEERLQREGMQRAAKPGASVQNYVKFYGEPTSEEIINGDVWYWYDDPNQPLYVVFRNSKLISRFVDKDTINKREIEAQTEIVNKLRREQYEAERAVAEINFQEQQRQRNAQAWKDVGTAIQNAYSPPTTTKCETRANQGYGGGFNTECK